MTRVTTSPRRNSFLVASAALAGANGSWARTVTLKSMRSAVVGRAFFSGAPPGEGLPQGPPAATLHICLRSCRTYPYRSIGPEEVEDKQGAACG